MSASLSPLDLVRAVSPPDRLRIIGTLASGPADALHIAEALGLTLHRTYHHLSYLAGMGLVRLRTAGRNRFDLYELDLAEVEALARREFAGRRLTYVPAAGLDPKTGKILAACLNADGTIKHIPLQPAKRMVLLQYLANAFQPGVNYSEKQVNELLRRFHEDTAGLRRDLVDAGWLRRERDGSRYWRGS